MKEFINFVAKSFVNESDNMTLHEQETESEYKLELHLPPHEVGKVIGKNGIMADSLRTICQFQSSKILKKPISFRIIEHNTAH